MASTEIRITVAPFAGAWIETRITAPFMEEDLVAPFAGAWIETPAVNRQSTGNKSLPSRERGLKLVFYVFYRWNVLSLPSRERGLKP